MENYKEDIVSTRVGGLGSSDAKMLIQISELGYVPKSAYKRLAVCKGLIEHEDIPRTAAVRAGDAIEMAIFEHLRSVDDSYQSNPLWVSKKYSRKNVKLLSHPDLVKQDDESKVLTVIEVKTTKYNFNETRKTYDGQLYTHYLLADEIAKGLGEGWKVVIKLCVYSTDGLYLENGDITFDPERLTVKQVRINRNNPPYDVNKAMAIISEFLDNFNEYYGDGEEVDANMLPDNVKEKFDSIVTALSEIKQREAAVNEFKTRLYDFMVEKNIKGIKNEFFTITRVDPTESKSFDSKRFVDDEMAKHPRKMKKIVEAYTKTTKKKGYVNLKLKNNNNE